MKLGKTLTVKGRKKWRAWLSKHHAKAPEIWLVTYKKHTGRVTVPYNDAVEEALCFGWIDSTVKALDKDRYAQRFSPRKTKSPWSDMNKERVRRLIKERRMTPAGLAAMQGGRTRAIPAPILKALRKDPETWANFRKFPESYKRIRIGWIAAHIKDRPAEYRKRLAYFLKMTKKNKRFGMVQ